MKVVAKGIEGNPLGHCQKGEDGEQHPHHRGHHAAKPPHQTTFDDMPTPSLSKFLYQYYDATLLGCAHARKVIHPIAAKEYSRQLVYSVAKFDLKRLMQKAVARPNEAC
jgi:hypothetical protein